MLNKEQEELKNNIQKFINGGENGFFGVVGAGGTGKTYVICQSIDVTKAIFLGATNKVVGNLRAGLKKNGFVDVNSKTVDSFLGFKMVKDHNNRTITKRRIPKLENIPKIIVIDEISLLNNECFEYLMKLKNKRKFILIGDNRQIPPIEDDFERDDLGFKVSKIFNQLDYKFELTIQQRQKKGSDLFDLIKNFRDNMHLTINFEKMANKFNNKNDILFYNNNDKELKEIIRGKNPIAVCFKNLTCLSFNWLIGSTKTNNKGYKVNELNVGDVVFFDGFYHRGDERFYTSETVTILEIDERVNDEMLIDGSEKVVNFNYKMVRVKKESGVQAIIYVGNGYKETLYPIKYRIDWCIGKLKKEIEKLKEGNKYKFVLQKKIAELNTKYNDLKLGFATLKKPFAITSHKSQGSTYNDVIIPIYDYANKYPQDVNQLMYVAMSRANERVIFVYKNSNFKDNSNRYSFSEMERTAIASSQVYKCNICEIDLEDNREFDVDHITPIANGGKNTLSNLQALCKLCHQEKTKHEKYNLTQIL
jgi:hypothetical protein